MSISIIAIRAFQPAAQPIESWSAFSWFLMLLPTFLPVVVALAFVVVMAIWAIVAAILD